MSSGSAARQARYTAEMAPGVCWGLVVLFMNAFAGCRRNDVTRATTDAAAAALVASSSSLASTARDAGETTVEFPVVMVVSNADALPEHAGKNGCIAHEPTPVPRFDDVSCAELEQIYSATLHRTGTCGCDADCSVAVCQDPLLQIQDLRESEERALHVAQCDSTCARGKTLPSRMQGFGLPCARFRKLPPMVTPFAEALHEHIRRRVAAPM